VANTRWFHQYANFFLYAKPADKKAFISVQNSPVNAFEPIGHEFLQKEKTPVSAVFFFLRFTKCFLVQLTVSWTRFA
jgi:hypothetical protein